MLDTILRDFPDHGQLILAKAPALPQLFEACNDYDRLSKLLSDGTAHHRDKQHIEEILSELRSEILRLASKGKS